MYKFCTLFVHFWSCTLMYIGFHQEKNTRDIGSKQASSAPLLLEFPNIQIIWGLKIHLSSVMYCGFQMLLNLLVMKFSIMDPVILSLRLRRLWLKYLASHLPFGDVFIKNLSFLHPDLRSSSDLSTSALSVAQKLKRFSAADQICCSNFNLSRPSLKPAARVWPPAWQNWSLLARRLQDRRQDWGDQYPAEKVTRNCCRRSQN